MVRQILIDQRCKPRLKDQNFKVVISRFTNKYKSNLLRGIQNSYNRDFRIYLKAPRPFYIKKNFSSLTTFCDMEP